MFSPSDRRGFLRGLVLLPRIGGGVTLVGSPTAAAVPVTGDLICSYVVPDTCANSAKTRPNEGLFVLYGFRIDKALLDIGIDPNVISLKFRRAMKAAGKRSALTPQEVALEIAARTPLALRPGLKVARLQAWIETERVDINVEEVREAYRSLGLFDLPPRSIRRSDGRRERA